MSVFDKFNVNPYITTYAGAPVAEFQQTANALQDRYYKTLDYGDKLAEGLSKIQGLGEDEAYLNEIKARYRDQIAAASEAPELGFRAVRNIGRNFAQDEDIKLIMANQAKVAAAQKKIDEGELSPYQVQKLTDALQTYGAEGGARRQQKLSLPTLYEEVDINKLIDEQVKGIKGFESGISRVVVKDGQRYIVSNTGFEVPEDKILGTASGVFNNPKVVRQLTDEMNYMNRSKQVQFAREGKDFTPADEITFKDMTERYMAPAIYKYLETKDTETIKGGGSGTGSSGRTGKSALTGTLFASEAEDVLESYGYVDDPEADALISYRNVAAAQKRMDAWDNSVEQDGYGAVQRDRDEKYVNVQRTSYKRALMDAEVLRDDPSLRSLIEKIPESELYEMNNRTVNTEGASGDINTILDGDIPDITAGQYGGGLSQVIKPFAEKYGDEVATILYQELTNQPDVQYVSGRTVIGGYGRLGQQARQAAAQTGDDYEMVLQNLTVNALQQAQDRISQMDPNFAGSFDKDKARNMLLKYDPDIRPEELEGYVNTLAEQTRGQSMTSRHDNIMRELLAGVPTDRKMQPANAVMSESDQANVAQGIASQFDSQNPDLSNLEQFKFLDKESGKMADLGDADYKELLQKYMLADPKGITVNRVDGANGSGYVELLVKSKEAKGDPLRLTVDLSATGFSDFRPMVSRNALEKMQTATTQADRDAYYEIYSSFAMAEAKRDIRAAYQNNGTMGGDMTNTPITITDQLLRTAFGNSVIPRRDVDGRFQFYLPNGKALLTLGGMNNMDKAIQELYSLANQRMANAATSFANTSEE